MTDSSQLPSALAMGALALASGTFSGAALLAYTVFVPRCQFWAPVVRSLPDRQSVALTFDDGPHPEFTPRILDLLAAHDLKAAFFVIGRFAEKHPALLQRMAAEGHTIGNHSLDHARFGVNQKRDYWRRQISETQRIVAEIVGKPPLLFRPPMGFKTGHIAAAAKEFQLPIIGWSVRGLDTRPVTADQLATRVLKQIGGHDIVLLHDGIESARGPTASQAATVEALPTILAGITDKRLRIVPLLDSLLRTPEEPELARRGGAL